MFIHNQIQIKLVKCRKVIVEYLQATERIERVILPGLQPGIGSKIMNYSRKQGIELDEFENNNDHVAFFRSFIMSVKNVNNPKSQPPVSPLEMSSKITKVWQTSDNERSIAEKYLPLLTTVGY